MRREILYAAASAALLLLFQATVVYGLYGGRWSGLFFQGDRNSPPPALAADTFVHPNSAGYDAQFSRYIAHDPFLTRGFAAHIDAPRLRSRRILLPLAAWAVAFGREPWIDGAYISLVLLATAAGVYWCTRMCGAWGLLFLLIPAVIASVDRMLLDGVLTSLTVGFLYYSRRGRKGKVYLLLLALPLTKEIGLLFTAGAAGRSLIERQWRQAAVWLSSALPAVAWFAYVRWRLPQPDNFADSFRVWTGIIDRITHPRTDPAVWIQGLLRVVDLTALAGLLVAMGVAVVLLRREALLEVRLTMGLFVLMALMLTLLSPDPDPYGYSRPVSPLLAYMLVKGVSLRRRLPVAASMLLTPAISVYPGAEVARILGLRLRP